jgi:prophage regulatory protein
MAQVWHKAQRALAVLCVAIALGVASGPVAALSAPPRAEEQQTAVFAGVAIIRRKQLLELLGISNATLWNWIKQDKFPQPIDIGPNSRAWLTAEVDEYLRARTAERDQRLARTPPVAQQPRC